MANDESDLVKYMIGQIDKLDRRAEEIRKKQTSNKKMRYLLPTQWDGYVVVSPKVYNRLVAWEWDLENAHKAFPPIPTWRFLLGWF